MNFLESFNSPLSEGDGVLKIASSEEKGGFEAVRKGVWKIWIQVSFIQLRKDLLRPDQVPMSDSIWN